MNIKTERIRKNMQATSVAIASAQVIFCSVMYSLHFDAAELERLMEVLEKVIRVYWS